MQSNIFTKTFKITCFSSNTHLDITVLLKSVEEFVRAQTVKGSASSLRTHSKNLPIV
jgi:hypothetical protein